MTSSRARSSYASERAICVLLISVAARGAEARAPETGALAGRVQLMKDGQPRDEHFGVVIYLEGVPALPGREAPAPTPVRQIDKRFIPPVAVVQRGAVVDFPNEDRIFHNVFSVSNTAKFDLGLYKSGESKSASFSRAGVVNVYCNIHPEMIAQIVVVDGPYFAITDRDGNFRVDRIPAGSYPLVAWHPDGTETRRTIEIRAGSETRHELRMDVVERSKRHLRKDGTPYGRYR